jgi:small-conductance mechanosensitive channel
MKLTGKSESTFRNLARRLKSSRSKDIKLEKLKTGHEKILFKESFINSYFDTSSKGLNKQVESNASSEMSERTLAILERELEEKNRQIEALTDRLKESNLLQAQLHEQVKLLEAPKKKKRWFGW